VNSPKAGWHSAIQIRKISLHKQKKTAAQAAVFFRGAQGTPRNAVIGAVLIVVVTSSAVL
jgi:hypothetical protein